MKKHNIQSGFGLIGVVIILIAVVAVGSAGYLVLNKNKTVTTKTNNSNSSSMDSSANKISTDKVATSNKADTLSSVSDYSTWKQYCSKTEKACFKYPGEWQLSDNNSGRDVDSTGNKITTDMESVIIKAPGTQYFTIGIEWNNYLSGLGGGCTGDNADLADILSYEKISSRPSDYIVEFTSKSAEGEVYFRLLNYSNQEPKVGLTDTCLNTFYNFFKGKNISRDILFQAKGTDKISKEVAKKVIQSFQYQ